MTLRFVIIFTKKYLFIKIYEVSRNFVIIQQVIPEEPKAEIVDVGPPKIQEEEVLLEENVPEAVEEIAKPVEETPELVEETSKPVEEVPEPVEEGHS